MDMAVSLMGRAEQPQDRETAAVQKGVEGREDPGGDPHRHDGVDRGGRRVLKGERFRDELADEHLQDRQDGEDEAHRHRVSRKILQPAKLGEERREWNGERRLGVGARGSGCSA